MRVVTADPLTSVLRIDAGEEVIETIREYCDEQEIMAASVSAIGAAKTVLVSWYDLTRKVYEDKQLEGQWEIVSLNGNVSLKNDKAFVHVHGAFSDKSMSVQGGHVKKLVVGATCEVILTVIEGSMQRQSDEETGLFLLCEATED